MGGAKWVVMEAGGLTKATHQGLPWLYADLAMPKAQITRLAVSFLVYPYSDSSWVPMVTVLPDPSWWAHACCMQPQRVTVLEKT